MAPDISIIILNYNTTDHVESLLNSILLNLDLNKYEIIVCDNNSSDKTYKELYNKYPFINIIENISNDGFGRGNNEAVKSALGTYILFLNPDVIILDDSLDYLKEYFETNRNIGFLSGVMVDDDKKPIYFYNKYWDIEWEFYQVVGMGYNRKIRKLLSVKSLTDVVPFEVDWFHGAFLFTSRELFNEIGGFNEDYFIYFEDVEICFRAKNYNKLKNVCIPSVKIEHLTRATFDRPDMDDIYNFHIYRGKLLFIRYYPFLYRNTIRFLSVAGVLLRLVILPFWKKFVHRKREKFYQLMYILRLHFDYEYLLKSKYKYIKR